jgi:hypothetical protein
VSGDELRRQSCPGGGPLEVFLVAAADDQIVLTALDQVPVGRGAVLGDMLVDRLADVLGQRDVAELPRDAELQTSRSPSPGSAVSFPPRPVTEGYRMIHPGKHRDSILANEKFARMESRCFLGHDAGVDDFYEQFGRRVRSARLSLNLN